MRKLDNEKLRDYQNKVFDVEMTKKQILKKYLRNSYNFKKHQSGDKIHLEDTEVDYYEQHYKRQFIDSNDEYYG